MNQYVLLTLAMLPPIAILWYLLGNDLKKRDNSLVYKLFLIGALLAVPIYYSETFLINNILKSNPFTNAFLVASLIEEGIKFIVFIIAIDEFKKAYFYTYLCILLFTGVSLGIATSENIIYVLNGGAETAFIRALFSIPLHACCSILMGFFFFSVKSLTWPSANYFYAFIIPFLIHGFYDYFLFAQDIPYWIAFIFIGFITYVCYELVDVVLTFQRSNYKKIKFSGEEEIVRPGGGEIYTIESFAERVVGVLKVLGPVIVITLAFFHTSLGDNVIWLIDEIRFGAIKVLGG